jgi:hypothetical protein
MTSSVRPSSLSLSLSPISLHFSFIINLFVAAHADWSQKWKEDVLHVEIIQMQYIALTIQTGFDIPLEYQF